VSQGREMRQLWCGEEEIRLAFFFCRAIQRQST
jgi:hypothetical protein